MIAHGLEKIFIQWEWETMCAPRNWSVNVSDPYSLVFINHLNFIVEHSSVLASEKMEKTVVCFTPTEITSVRVLLFMCFANSRLAHLCPISERLYVIQAKRSKYRRNLFSSHTHSCTQAHTNAITWPSATRIPYDFYVIFLFSRNSLPSHLFVSFRMQACSLSRPTVCTAILAMWRNP